MNNQETLGRVIFGWTLEGEMGQKSRDGDISQ
jgi:hypothetical protein